MRIATLANASVIHTRRWVEYFRSRGHEVGLWSLEAGPEGLGARALPRFPLPGFARYPLALPALKLTGHGPIASVPNWVTFTPDSKTIYISNAAIKSVTAIDTERMAVKALIPVGEVPKRITTLVTK